MRSEWAQASRGGVTNPSPLQGSDHPLPRAQAQRLGDIPVGRKLLHVALGEPLQQVQLSATGVLEFFTRLSTTE